MEELHEGFIIKSCILWQEGHLACKKSCSENPQKFTFGTQPYLEWLWKY